MKKKLMRLASLALGVSMVVSMGSVFASAREPLTNGIENEAVLETISAVEAHLKEKETSIASELMELRQEYQKEAVSASNRSEKEHWDALVDGVDLLISDYMVFESFEKQGNIDVNRDAINDAYLTTAVAAVVTWFSSNGYSLSSELLVTARNNTDEDRVYIPANKNVVRTSSETQYLIKSGKPIGSHAFPADNPLDLYYSIHKFDYQKKASVLIITDVYDYEYGDQSYGDIAEVAINAMARAQAAGIIVPYNVRIDVTF